VVVNDKTGDIPNEMGFFLYILTIVSFPVFSAPDLAMSETDSLLSKVSINTSHRCSSVGILSENEKRLVEQAR